jgi:PAS domain S-box-containing protein
MCKGIILIVEDEAIVAEDISERLQRLGYEVCAITGRGREAVEIAEAKRPDLVLMDIQLTGTMSGIEAANRIHKEIGTPVIFMTAHSDKATLELAKSCDPYGYILKPFQEHQLESHIEVALNKHALEDRLRQSEHQFRILAEQSPDSVLRFDREGRFLYANSRSVAFLGVPAECVVGKTCEELGLPGPFCVFCRELIAKTFRSGRGQERDFKTDKESRPQFFQIRTAPEVDGGAELQAIIATVRDVTRRRSDERRMLEVSQRLLYHVNNSPLSVMEWDADGKCLSWNGEAEELFGWTRQEAVKKLPDCLPLVHPEDRHAFKVILDRLRSGKQASDFVKSRTVGRNGSMAFCEWHLSSLIDDDGHSRSILCLVSDVTDRERAEQDLQRLNDDLEVTILRRTSELKRSNEELRHEIQTRRQLECDIISISEREHRRIGHDLHDGICQELAGIRFSVEAISKQCKKNVPLRGQLDQIALAVERASHHTRLLSRGLAPLDLEFGDLAAALEELAGNSSTLFQISCIVHLRGSIPKFELEKATNLFRIAQEAIQNAIKHGNATEIRITLDLTGKEASLTVSDNGTGFPAHRPAPPPGSGMGLKIMHHRAGLIQGTMEIGGPETGGAHIRCKFPK